jgi:RimJ/RimL family protein N-acetyltransferase
LLPARATVPFINSSPIIMDAFNTVLETERLVLRPPRLEDFDDIFAMWSDVEVTRLITGAPFTREEAWARLLRGVGHWVLQGFGHWIVREKQSGKFVGEVGFVQYRRGVTPTFDDAPEAGWMLARAAQRQGYASEAVRAALQWADARWPGGRTVCIISPENARSLDLARKFAYVEQGRVSYKGEPTVLLERTPSLSP